MAMLAHVFEERVAAAMATSARASCELKAQSPQQCGSPSISGSTRASSPGGESSGSCGNTSSGPSSPCSNRTDASRQMTLAQRRGLRAAILSDLGVEMDCTPKGCFGPQTHSPAATATPTSNANAGVLVGRLTGTRPAPGTRGSICDASQRTPLPRNIAQASPSTPYVNSRFSPNCLGSSPGSGGDASQRSPAARAARHPFSGASPTTPTGVLATSTVPNCLMSQNSLQSCTSLLRTPGKDPLCAAVDASSRGNVNALGPNVRTGQDMIEPTSSSDESLTQMLKHTGMEALSNEEIAMRLYAAAPVEYED